MTASTAPGIGAVTYAREDTLTVSEFRQVLVESGLGSIRPVDDEERLQRMLDGAGLVVTARLSDGTLAGVACTLADFSWVAYLSDLAVSRKAQGLGIGKGLVEETRSRLGPEVSLVLISVPDAVSFYGRIGMARTADAFWYQREH